MLKFTLFADQCSGMASYCCTFDYSYLASLEGWLDRTVVAWLCSAPSIQPTEVAPVRTQLIGCLHETYTKTRIEQLLKSSSSSPSRSLRWRTCGTAWARRRGCAPPSPPA